MLKYLKIQNFLIIDNQELIFDNRYNVIVGETGSGKSIILKALAFVLGKRIDGKVIRPGCEKAIITAEFDISAKDNIKSALNQYEIEYSDNIIIRRIIKNDSSSKIFLNDQIISNNIVKNIFANLIEIQTQHEKNNLYDNNYILKLIDNFHGNFDLCNEVKDFFQKLKFYRDHLIELNNKAKKIEIETQFYNQIYSDLSNLNPSAEDFEKLTNLIQSLKESSNYQNSFKIINAKFNEENGILSLVNDSLKEVYNLENYKPKFVDNISQELSKAFDQLSLISDNLTNEFNEINNSNYDEEELKERFSEYKSFARKYRTTEIELEQTLKDAQNNLNQLNNLDKEITKTRQIISEISEKFLKSAKKLSDLRKKTTETIRKDIKSHLSGMNMAKAELNIDIKSLNSENWNENGTDLIEFLISTNPGQPFVALRNTISGGEMSRILLAIKLCFSKKLSLNTIIFDEIDAGIGGETAELIAEKLLILSKSIQIIAITHNEILSKKSDKKLIISKVHKNNATYSQILSA